MTNRRNIFFYHNNSPKLFEVMNSLYELARKYDFNIVEDSKDASIITSVGDDGTFLQAVRKTGFRDDCLYAGISTTDKLNMYCDFSILDPDKIIEAITNKQIEVRKYPTIEASLDNHSPFLCLNELSIRSSIIKAFVLEVFIDDFHFETFHGDGMIISTPTGSTAYNKSIHGAIVDPKLPCYQISELASINNNTYRTLGSPFILSGEHKLTLRIGDTRNGYPIVGMDNEALSIANVDKVHVKLGSRVIKTVKLKDNSFWQKVQRTFL
ncbi:NAD kinase [Bacillus massiliigorillae]|uniref:NAD kinase n=1 Tax=Bacillus massiliigorillae TaxID=1243664 RepID=UPI00039AF923|nr:NAD kinase [Bacillus massiliigorillae]